MSTTEAIMVKVSALPPEKQKRVLDYVNSIGQPGDSRLPEGKPHEWLDIALEARLQGPPDWSEHLDEYLYGDTKNGS